MGRAVMTRMVCALALVAAMADSCPKTDGSAEDKPCEYGGLVLAADVVCVRAEPHRHEDGTWSYPASNPKAKRLRPGVILIVARKSVRRVESVRRDGDDVVLSTAAVPLTEVIQDGTIPLNAAVDHDSIHKTDDQPPAAPAPEAPGAVTNPAPVSPPVHSPPVAPRVSFSVQETRPSVTVPCASNGTSTSDQGPVFQATVTTTGGPLTVHYHWSVNWNFSGTRDGVGPTQPPGTLTFSGTGPQSETVELRVPVLYAAPGDGTVTFHLDDPAGGTVDGGHAFTLRCFSVSEGGPRPKFAPMAAVSKTVNGYQIEPKLTLHDDGFGVAVTATRDVGPARLTWTLHGELRNFTSAGSLRITGHRLRDSSFGAHGLSGQLGLEWKLSAQIPPGLTDLLSLDHTIQLFTRPLLIGDFPIVLAVSAQLHLGPQFRPGNALHGQATIDYTGGQGVTLHLRAIDQATGPEIGRLRIDPGISDLLRLPSLTGSVNFPYISVGDDFYSTGVLVWTYTGLTITVTPRLTPTRCARASASVKAAAGVTFELFGLRHDVSAPAFDHPLSPSATYPPSTPCIT